ncbi:MAG: Methyltransferase type 12 [Deltaproteobacteria bacterium]|nr:Methyltransferase type 12 [Deltaproteobacteria bacterium]MBS1243645.1 Methyltransferase type 12 [Deltaproteobacteria bacterium]
MKPASPEGETGNLASQEFWEKNWAVKKRPGQYNPRNYSHRRIDAFFRRHLQGTAGRTILEVGCAQSSWLPYFHLAYGCRVVGIDYSPTGCRMARQLLDEAGVPGDVHQRDLFADNSDLEGTADFLFSLGFIEHFPDTAGVLSRMRRLLKPGGTILTIVPNFAGWLSAIQQRVYLEFYRMHIPLDLPDLERVHRMAGFSTVEAGYLGSIASEVVKYPLPTPLRLRVLRKLLKKVTKTCWFLFGATGHHPETRRFSPYIAYVGIRTDDGPGEKSDLPPSRS